MNLRDLEDLFDRATQPLDDQDELIFQAVSNRDETPKDVRARRADFQRERNFPHV